MRNVYALIDIVKRIIDIIQWIYYRLILRCMTVLKKLQVKIRWHEERSGLY